MTAGWLDDVRGPPARLGLARMAEAIAPGSRVANVRRLGGGLGAAMHRIDLLLPDGGWLKLVLRRYPRMAIAEDAQVAARAWRTLDALQRLGVSAPRPVWEDLDGGLFGTPAFAMTRLPGHSRLWPRDAGRWLRELADALAALHHTPTDAVDLSFLRGAEETLKRRYAVVMREEVRAHALGRAVQEAISHWWPRLHRASPVLLHGDYWAGNTLWMRGRLTAIVDWDDARLGPPGFDLGYCRMDLAVGRSVAAADEFLRAYEAAAGRRVPQLFLWDLVGAALALPNIEHWLPGFHELGLTEMTVALANERLADFIEDTLRRAGA